jgi:peptidoglycan/LPS O-acetylase OafA/YrhL
VETGKAERKHIYYFDYLRIFALVSVIFMHAASAPLRAGVGGTDWQLTSVFTSLAFTAVPLFPDDVRLSVADGRERRRTICSF